ncbi:MAG: pentapeptide repeat-containing protein [Nitrosomonadaceae bacterium]
MANEEHLKILKQGVEAWNEWREKNPQITPDLSTANLNKEDLYEADLNKANLNKADLSAADLSAADLSGANFSGAQDLTAKQLIFTINWQEAILDFSLRVEAEKLIAQKNR